MSKYTQVTTGVSRHRHSNRNKQGCKQLLGCVVLANNSDNEAKAGQEQWRTHKNYRPFSIFLSMMPSQINENPPGYPSVNSVSLEFAKESGFAGG